MNLVTSLKRKNLLNVKCRNSTKPLFLRDTTKPEVIKPPNIIKTRRIYANKRKYFRDKNLEFNSEKKVNIIPCFSTNPPY